MKLNFSQKDSQFFKIKFEQVIEKIIRYYIFNGYNTGEIFKLCCEVLMDSIKEKNNILESLYESNDFSLNYASLLVSYPYTEDLDYKRGEVVGIDSKGYVLIKAEPGWIPRHPFIKRETNLDYETWAVLTSVDL